MSGKKPASADPKNTQSLESRAWPDWLLRLARPWKGEGKTELGADEIDRRARLAQYKDWQDAVGEARQLLLKAGVARARLTAETLEREWECRQVRLRAIAADREEGLLLDLFRARLKAIDGLGQNLPPEITDALRERALEQFTLAANRMRKGGLG